MNTSRICFSYKRRAPLFEETQETIIVGGGMSGIGCAHRLVNNVQPFLMIAPEIGGRVRTSADGTVNYGAYYVTDDYQWTLPLVKTVERLRIADGFFHAAGKRYRFRSARLVKHLPALLRFTSDLRRFRERFNHMNKSAGDFSRRELIAADPALQHAYDQPAGEYIRARRLEGLFADYIDPLLWASFFEDPYKVSTFFVLAASLPLIVPMHTFVFNTEKAIFGFRDRIVYDSVQRIERGDKWQRVITTSGREFRCRNLVLATPMDRTNRLLGPLAQPIRGGIDVSFYHVRGTLRAPYRGAKRNFFSSEEGTILSEEQDGSYLYYYAKDQIDKYFESYEVIAHDRWKPALFFHGKQFVNSNPAPHIFIASDHDMPSMENAYLNGRYTANLLMRQPKRGQGSKRFGVAV
jgi:glycine/D-amino acid oxidase-like deaminating enzyme